MRPVYVLVAPLAVLVECEVDDGKPLETNNQKTENDASGHNDDEDAGEDEDPADDNDEQKYEDIIVQMDGEEEEEFIGWSLDRFSCEG